MGTTEVTVASGHADDPLVLEQWNDLGHVDPRGSDPAEPSPSLTPNAGFALDIDENTVLPIHCEACDTDNGTRGWGLGFWPGLGVVFR